MKVMEGEGTLWWYFSMYVMFGLFVYATVLIAD